MFSDWLVINKPIQFVLGDVQLWVVLIFAAAVVYWVMDWAGENPHPRRQAPLPPPALPQEPELADSGKSV